MPEALAQITTLHNKKAQQAGFAKFRYVISSNVFRHFNFTLKSK